MGREGPVRQTREAEETASAEGRDVRKSLPHLGCDVAGLWRTRGWTAGTPDLPGPNQLFSSETSSFF